MPGLFDRKNIFPAAATFCVGLGSFYLLGFESPLRDDGATPQVTVDSRLECTFVGSVPDDSFVEKLSIWRELGKIQEKLKKNIAEDRRAALELRQAELNARLKQLEIEKKLRSYDDGPPDGTKKLVYREVCYEK